MSRARLTFLGAFAGAALAAALLTILVVTEGPGPASSQPPAVQVPPDDPVLRDAFVRPVSIPPTVQPRNGGLGESGGRGDCQAPGDPAPFEGTQVLSPWHWPLPRSAAQFTSGDLRRGVISGATGPLAAWEMGGRLMQLPGARCILSAAQSTRLLKKSGGILALANSEGAAR